MKGQPRQSRRLSTSFGYYFRILEVRLFSLRMCWCSCSWALFYLLRFCRIRPIRQASGSWLLLMCYIGMMGFRRYIVHSLSYCWRWVSYIIGVAIGKRDFYIEEYSMYSMRRYNLGYYSYMCYIMIKLLCFLDLLWLLLENITSFSFELIN